MRGSPRFAPIAGYTGADHIIPGMPSTTEAWQDMVKGKLSGLFAAILTDIAVTIEYLKAGQLSFTVGTLNHETQPYDGGDGENIRNGVDKAHTVLNHLRFALVNQYEGTPGTANGKRLIAIVQYQNRYIDHIPDSSRNLFHFTRKLTSVQMRPKETV